MAGQSSSLLTFYGGWKGYHDNIVKVLSPLTSEQLSLPTAPHHWSIGTVAQHIVANRVWWFQVWMGQGDEALAPIAGWDPRAPEESPEPDAGELVAAFESTWGMIEDALDDWTAADLDDVLAQPDALTEEERPYFVGLTRGWVIWHVLEHEIFHGGELSLALGGHGLATIYDF